MATATGIYWCLVLTGCMSLVVSGKAEVDELLINIFNFIVRGQNSVVSFNQSSPLYPVVCPGDKLVFTCVVEGGGVAWRRNNDNNPAILTYGHLPIPSINDFTLSIASYDNGVLVSTATNLSVPVELDGSTIGCSVDTMNYNTLTINIAGNMYQHVMI